jgi:prephenate dehydrogenase
MSSLSCVTVIGTGLIGTSVALALRDRGVEVRLADHSPDAVRQAAELGAGVPLTDQDQPADLVVIAVPPLYVAEVLYNAQRRELGACYTDVASVKAPVIAAAERRGCDFAAFVPSHPMAGSERKGPATARADLFAGHAWALCPTSATSAAAVEVVTSAARLTGAVTYELDAEAHDRAAAVISHLPHLVSSVLAGRLAGVDPATLRLAGRGLLDVTRVAAGDVRLWTDILTHNAKPVAELVDSLADDLKVVSEELRQVAANGGASADGLAAVLSKGNAGRERLLTSRPAS